MKRPSSSASLIKLLIASIAIAAAVSACTTKKKELTSKVDPNSYVKKTDIISTSNLYHFSRAIEEADSNNTVEAIPGFQQDFGLVKAEITETELRLLTAFDPTGRPATAQVLVSFPIKEHFDIVREENDFKEKTNKVVEDRTRPWNQREFMRVDWANPSNKTGSFLSQVYGRGISESGTVLKADPQFDKDGHMSFVVETGIEHHRASRFLPPFGEQTVSAYRVTYRTHLTPVKASDFKPVPYSLKDFGRFGYFVTQQNFENPEKGFLDKDLKIYANIHNVCEAGRAESCSKNQIKWVLTKGFPEKYLDEARMAVKKWNETFKEALNRTDDVVVLDETTQVDLSDTRFNTIAYYEPKANGGLLGVAQWVSDPRTGELVSTRATVYEDGIRYEQGMIDNLIDLISSDDPLSQVIGTEAFGPQQNLLSPYSAANGRTAMEIQHTLMGLSRKAETGTRPGVSDLANIVGLRAQGSTNASGRNIPAYLKGNTISKASLDAINKARPDLLRVPDLDQLVQNAAAQSDDETADSKLSVTERMLKVGEQLRAEKTSMLRQSSLGIHGSELVEEAVVRFLAKQINETKNTKALASHKEEIKAKVAKLIFYTTLLHEMGHTFGLRHNFKGSADRQHYYPEWKQLKAQIDAGSKDLTKDDLAPYAYSSIMDYGADFFSQAGGLGPYDKAAIKYAYNRSIDRDNDQITKEKFYFCTDHQVDEEILCRRFDRGSTVTEVTEHNIERYNRNWALKHFRRGRATFDETGPALTDGLIAGTMIPVRQVMDEFVYSLITKQPSVNTNATCRWQFMEEAIQNGDMVNVCDADKAKEAGVDLGDMTTWARSLFNKDGKLLKPDSGEMKPYGLADLIRANEVAQKFFAEVIGSVEPGYYLAAEGKATTPVRALVALDRDLARQDLADVQAGKPSGNRALKKLAKDQGETDVDAFVKTNAGNLVRIDVGRYGRPFSSTMKEEGTMRMLQSVGSQGDKIAATIALALRDIGVMKYSDISMTGNPYDYPQSKIFTTQLFTRILTEDLKIAPMPLTLASGQTILGVGQAAIDTNVERIGIILALTQFVTDADPSAIQKLRVCITGESQCGNALSSKSVEAWNSTGAFQYKAVDNFDGDSISFQMVSKLKKLSDKRAPFIEKLTNGKKAHDDDVKQLLATTELRQRIQTTLDLIPAAAEKLKPLVMDKKDGVEAQGFAAVVDAVQDAESTDVDGYVQAVVPGLTALRSAAAAVDDALAKMGDNGKCTDGDEQKKAACAKEGAGLARATLTKLSADFKALVDVVRTVAISELQIKQAPQEVKDQSDAIAGEEVKLELLRMLMSVLGWK